MSGPSPSYGGRSPQHINQSNNQPNQQSNQQPNQPSNRQGFESRRRDAQSTNPPSRSNRTNRMTAPSNSINQQFNQSSNQQPNQPSNQPISLAISEQSHHHSHSVPSSPRRHNQSKTQSIDYSHDRAHEHSNHHPHDNFHDHAHNHSDSHSYDPDDQDDQSNDQASEGLQEALHFTDIIYHLESYQSHQFARFDRLINDFNQMDPGLKCLVPFFGTKMVGIKRYIQENQKFFRQATSLRGVFQGDPTINYEYLERMRILKGKQSTIFPHNQSINQSIDEEKMSKVKSTLRQCIRDWSIDGEKERAQCYTPILRELDRLFPSTQSSTQSTEQSTNQPVDRSNIRVLVPGSGLARLTWEVARAGFDSQGNEFSYFMLIVAFMILNHQPVDQSNEQPDLPINQSNNQSNNQSSSPQPINQSTNQSSSPTPNAANQSVAWPQWSIYPYISETKNVMRTDDMFRRVQIPDVDVRQLSGKFSMVAGDFMEIYSEEGPAYRERVERARNQPIAQSDRSPRSGDRLSSQSIMDQTPSPRSPQPPQSNNQSNNLSSSDSDSSDDEPETSTSHQRGAWDAVTTCYFIDCANNILEFVRAISFLLKPGGYWINFGPLLYHYSEVNDEMSIELSYEELKATFPAFGLKLIAEKTNRQSAYTLDERSMMRTHYYCVEFTCQKVGPDTTRWDRNDNMPNIHIGRKKTRRGKGKKARIKAEREKGNVA